MNDSFARSLLIRPALSSDVPQVIKLAAQHELSAKSPDRILREGFLISGYPPEKYLRWLEHLRIAQADGDVAGFILSFRRFALPLEVEDSDKVFAAAGDEDFLLIKQIGVSPSHQHQGIGRKLYSAELQNVVCPAFAPIVVLPRNTVSIAFHEALGFRCISTYDSGGMKRGIWRLDRCNH